uniref:Small serum protein 2-like n=1 Tax=Podarcis muralis TaxID=64176 RepID=A0A670IP32_PODMU
MSSINWMIPPNPVSELYKSHPNSFHKILLSLTAFSLTLALCQGPCIFLEPKEEIKDGKPVLPTECTDPINGSKHPFLSKWNTTNCMKCVCSEEGALCCSRHSGLVERQGCKALFNPNKCEYEFYKLDDPSKPCP